MTSEKFDPTTYEWGKAYWTGYGSICYPSRVREDLLHVVHRGCEILTTEKPDTLTRAPKYDLIPRADVMELVKALEHISADHTGHCPYVAEQTLAYFKQKYGDV
jgi:hypothetical protein